MFRNYLKTAIRNLWKSKVFSFINIIGLALGLTCSLLIMLWVSDESKVDAFHKNGSRLLSTFEANNKILKQEGNYAGQDFFKMFSYPLLQGNAATALLAPSDIAVSRKMATAFFGSPAKAI